MKYRAVFREIQEADLSRDCKFIPDTDEFEDHLKAIYQDIKAIDGVSGVTDQPDKEVLITTKNLSLAGLKSELKSTLQNEFQYARLVEIAAV